MALDPKTEARLKRAEAKSARKLRRLRHLDRIVTATRAVLEYRKFPKAARAIFDEARAVTGGQAGYIALLSEDRMENKVVFLEPGGHVCTVDEGLPMPIRGIRGRAVEEKRTLIDNDFMSSDDVKYLPEGHVPVANVLMAPLIVGGEVVGLMGLASKDGDFTEADAELASLFAQFAAISLGNSQLLEGCCPRCKSTE